MRSSFERCIQVAEEKGRIIVSEKLKAVRITSFEVSKVEGDWGVVTGRWHGLADEVKGVFNCFWQTWELRHVANGSRQKLQAWLDARQAASDAVKVPVHLIGKKKGQPDLNKYNTLKTKAVNKVGPCPVDPMPKELAAEINQAVKAAFPKMNSRCRTLVLNTLTKDLKKHKASKGRLPGHSAILLYHQSRPGARNSMPIPFDTQNAKFIPPKKLGGNYQLSLRLNREGDRVRSKPDILHLQCKGRKVSSQVAILKRIVGGEYKFCGSQLIYSSAKRKWFAQISYQMPVEVKPGLDPDVTAVLYARKDWPWTLITPMGRKMPSGRGRFIAGFRAGLLKQRWNRRAKYKIAGHSSKGHGRERAGAGVQWKLQQLWNNFTKSLNHHTTTEVVDWCVSHGIGKLIYVQPEGDFAESRFLHNTGKIANSPDSTGWTWFQLGTFLKYKCQEKGIELVIKKRSGGRFSKVVKPKREESKELVAELV